MAKRGGPTLVQRSRRVSPQTKAYYHQVAGAGKSRVRRDFLGLSDRELLDIGYAIAKGVQVRLTGGRL